MVLAGGSLSSDAAFEVGGALTVASGVDLAGHVLVLAGVTSIAGPGSFTDSVGGGVLDIEATDSFRQTVDFTGALRFVKRGPGTVTMGWPQTYSGGTEVREGELTASKYSVDPGTSPFGYPPRIAIYPGGRLDPHGGYKGYATHVFDLFGGCIVSDSRNNASTGDTYRFDPTVNLHAASRLAVDGGKTNNFSGTLDLGGHELSVEVGARSCLYWRPSSVSRGTVSMSGEGTARLVSDVDMRAAELRLGAALDLGGYRMDVSNYVPVAETAAQSSPGVLAVHGEFAPAVEAFLPPVMMDGSTILLSGVSGVWRPRSRILAAPGARVAMDVGAREVAPGDQLAAWHGGAPQGAMLSIKGEHAGGLALRWDDSGAYAVNVGEKPVAAEWTGLGRAGDTGDAANWRCTAADGTVVDGALPDASMSVSVPYSVLASASCPAGGPFACARAEFSGERPAGTVRLERDLDWRGFGAMEFPFPVDLRGHALRVTLAGDSPDGYFSVSSSTNGGELHVSVPAGVTYVNDKIAMSGVMSFFKEGAGTYVAAKRPQTYEGETFVTEGVLRCAALEELGEASPFGASRSVDVMPGGTLDPAGSYGWSGHVVALHGGMVSNTVAQTGTDNQSFNVSAGNMPRPFDPIVELFEDSVFATSEDFNFRGRVRGRGCVLRVDNAATLRWAPVAAERVLFDFGGGGTVKTLLNFPVYTPAASVRMGDATFDAGGDMTVSNYTAATAGKVFAAYRSSTPRLNVRGVFTPAGNFFGCTMLDGSTICLAGLDGVWSTRCPAASKGRDTVDFAPGAEVTIDVGGRTFLGRRRIVAWAEGSTNGGLDTARFRLDAASRASGYRLSLEPFAGDGGDGGLYVERNPFFVIFR